MKSGDNNQTYRDLLSSIIEPEILKQILLFAEAEPWIDTYSSINPPEIVENNFKNAFGLKDEKITIDLPWRIVHRFITFIDNEFVIPLIEEQKDNRTTGCILPLQELRVSDHFMAYMNMVELAKILTDKLEYHIYTKLLIPRGSEIYTINEKWELMVINDIDNVQIELMTPEEIEVALELKSGTGESELPKIARDKINKQADFFITGAEVSRNN